MKELRKYELPIPGAAVTLSPLGASDLIDTTVSRAQEGREANVWGAAFESAVQDMIDQSAWRPPDELRPLIGRVI
jgi:hypothetical protein